MNANGDKLQYYKMGAVIHNDYNILRMIMTIILLQNTLVIKRSFISVTREYFFLNEKVLSLDVNLFPTLTTQMHTRALII